MNRIFIGLIFCCSQLFAKAQSDSALVAKHALLFADSLVKADHYEEWNTYTALTPPDVIRYYGGKEGFLEHVARARLRYESTLAVDEGPALKLLQLLNDMDQWQCLVQEVRPIYREEKKYYVYTSLIGQSLDNGATWKFFDVEHNTPQNVIYMMPAIFGDLAIPVPRVIPEAQELAIEAKESAKKDAAN